MPRSDWEGRTPVLTVGFPSSLSSQGAGGGRVGGGDETRKCLLGAEQGAGSCPGGSGRSWSCQELRAGSQSLNWTSPPEVSQPSLSLDLLLSSLGFNFSSPLFSHLFLYFFFFLCLEIDGKI